jgi:DNA repair exonuclease SbcCD ATPase subunit
MFIDDSVVFTVIDEGNEISMEKLSGAQSFAVSLSFRLALSSTGICKFRCNQLFIDEGFCSFDQTNLVNVPELMTNLKNLFQEIVLVTHLQEIKSCADTIVNITRKDGISKISQF